MIEHRLAHNAMMQMLYLQSVNPRDAIHVFVDSLGGVVDDGLAMVDILKSLATPVRTHCIGIASGMAALLMAAGNPGLRTALPSARFQLVPATTTRPDEPERIAKTIQAIADEFSQFMRKPSSEVLKLMSRSSEFDATEAIDAGLIDQLCEDKAD
jgi:ATP-dependent Clp protease protease subunit